MKAENFTAPKSLLRKKLSPQKVQFSLKYICVFRFQLSKPDESQLPRCNCFNKKWHKRSYSKLAEIDAKSACMIKHIQIKHVLYSKTRHSFATEYFAQSTKAIKLSLSFRQAVVFSSEKGHWRTVATFFRCFPRFMRNIPIDHFQHMPI